MFKTLNMVYKNHWKSRKLCCLKLFVNPVGRHINIIRKVYISYLMALAETSRMQCLPVTATSITDCTEVP